MNPLRSLFVGSLGAVAIVALAGPAHADRDDWHHHYGHPHGWYRPWVPPAVVVAPRPYYYAPPAYYAPPPPVVYAPPPVYYAPPPTIGFTIR